MIHTDIIKYILNPLLNWNDCCLINQVTNITLKKSKHQRIVWSDDSCTLYVDNAVVCLHNIYHQQWRKDGEYHRTDKDENGYTLPADIWLDGSKGWYKDGKRHRTDRDLTLEGYGYTLPAIIESNGTKVWFKDGERHNSDVDVITGYTLPAFIDTYGNKLWYKDGKQHRTDRDENGLTLPAVNADETKIWYKDGETHNSDIDVITGYTLPACIDTYGNKMWYKDGQFHRTDIDKNGELLPAIIWSDGREFWYINGEMQNRLDD